MSRQWGIGLVACTAGAALSVWGAGRLLYERYGAGDTLDVGDYWPLWTFPAVLCAGLHLALPPTVEPTSAPGDDGRCDWRFVFRMQLAGGAPYEAEFPVLVSPAHRSSMAPSAYLGEY